MVGGLLGSDIDDSMYSIHSARDLIKIMRDAEQSIKNNKVFSFRNKVAV